MTDKQEDARFTDAVEELGASNGELCFKLHFNEARKVGVSKEDLREAVETAQMVKDCPVRSIAELADEYLREPTAKAAPCCCGSGDSKPTGGKKSCC